MLVGKMKNLQIFLILACIYICMCKEHCNRQRLKRFLVAESTLNTPMWSVPMCDLYPYCSVRIGQKAYSHI